MELINQKPWKLIDQGTQESMNTETEHKCDNVNFNPLKSKVILGPLRCFDMP